MLQRISTYFDGHQIELSEEEAKRYSRVPRFTYRSNFPAIFSITSDSGWGCCFRTAQGLVASFLLRYASVEPELYFQKFPTIPLLGLFEDHQDMPFSIQNLVNVCTNFGVKAGTWAKPSQMSATIMTILKDHKIDCIAAVDSNIDPTLIEQVKYPILVLIPALLGMNEIDKQFYPFIREVFRRKELVGVISGYSAFSYFIVGMTENKENVIYFDPHVTHEAVLSCQSHEDFFSQPAKAMPLKSMNPSMLFGFICESKEKAAAMIEDLIGVENSPITSKSIDIDLIDQVLDIDDLSM
jgi:cysteine protease ATG4